MYNTFGLYTETWNYYCVLSKCVIDFHSVEWSRHIGYEILIHVLTRCSKIKNEFYYHFFFFFGPIHNSYYTREFWFGLFICIDTWLSTMRLTFKEIFVWDCASPHLGSFNTCIEYLIYIYCLLYIIFNF